MVLCNIDRSQEMLLREARHLIRAYSETRDAALMDHRHACEAWVVRCEDLLTSDGDWANGYD